MLHVSSSLARQVIALWAALLLKLAEGSDEGRVCMIEHGRDGQAPLLTHTLPAWLSTY